MAVRTATPTTGWLLRGADGRLTAYAPTAGGLARWTETRPGGPEWTGPELLTVPGLEPYLSLTQNAAGYVYLVGLRRRELDDGRTETDVVYATQFQSGRALTPWRSIGTPYGQDAQRADQIGVPTAVVDSVGLHVFVRNAGDGVCGRRQDGRGIWQAWTDMKGSHVLDELTAARTDAGRIELLAPAAEFVVRWRQEEAGGPLRRILNLPAKPMAGSSSSAPTGDDRITHFWRDATDSALHAHRSEGSASTGGEEGLDTPCPTVSGGTGSGPVAALRATVDGHGCTVLAQRAASGLPALAAYPADDEQADVFWSETGEECVGAPALALDAHGRVVLAALGTDGRLRVARQRTDEAGLALGAWDRV
ncbi:hypothetical protein [Streptomyces syringium]|uniref:hypothetical protein n=1 Tax=Streptomyces syringium TaxID=76729 RepID=UPI0033C86EC0